MGHREDSIWWAKVGKIGSAVEILTGIACFGIMAGGGRVGLFGFFGGVFVIMGAGLFILNHRILKKMRKPK